MVIVNPSMHEYSFEPHRRNGSSSKRSIALSRREVSFQPQKKQRKSDKKKDPKSPSSRSSSVHILTSSRPSTAKDRDIEQNRLKNDVSASLPPISASKFYEIPKSSLEKQYERNLEKFVPIDMSDDFDPLESEGTTQDHENVPQPSHQWSKRADEAIIDKGLKSSEKVVMNLDEVLSSVAKEREFHVMYFIHASDSFMTKAHSLVLGANDVCGARVYYNFVKLAIKALNILLNEYGSSLNPHLESIIYQKLGMLYLKETQCLDKAEQFVSMSISMAKKHHLDNIRVVSEFLYCQVLEALDHTSLLPFLADKQAYYEKEGYLNIAKLYSMMKMKQLVVGATTLGSANFTSHSSETEPHPHITTLSLIHDASMNLYRGSSSSARASIKKAQSSIMNGNSPPQLVALGYLTMLSFCAQVDDVNLGKACVDILSELISSQREENWGKWRDDGIFDIEIPLFAETSQATAFHVQWLTSDEFVILFYFLHGTLGLTNYLDSEQTKKILSFCLHITNIQLGQLTEIGSTSRSFRVSYLSDRIVRLGYIRYSTIFYQLWIEMRGNDFGSISSIKSFLDCFDGENFTKEEMCYYALLVPKYLYLAALYYHSRGDLSAAKYYYIRVRKAFCGPSDTDSATISTLQNSLGIGCEALMPRTSANELYLFSTIQLGLIVERDVLSLSSNRFSRALVKSKLITCHSLLYDLLSDLHSALTEDYPRDSKSARHHQSSGLLQLYHNIVLLLRLQKDVSTQITTQHIDQWARVDKIMRESSLHGYVKVLFHYLLYTLSTSLEARTEHLEKTISSMTETDEQSLHLGVLLLSNDDACSSFLSSAAYIRLKENIALAQEKLVRRFELASLSDQI
ncbi:hypothetical protein OXX79_007977 [Metschnikowia pulcherrima]